MVVIRAEIHKMLVRIANREDPDQIGINVTKFQILVAYKKV